jgi:protein gp37
MAKSHIEWTEQTWNPTTGCNKVSRGCKFCYAEVFAKRLQAMGVKKYENGFELTLHPEVLNLPRYWKPSIIFVNSMSDLFHEKIPLEYIRKVFKVMNECPQHQFQVLTKRAELLEEYAPVLKWTSNIWMGVSVENQDMTFRIQHLKRTPARIKFLSLEPLIGPLINLDLQGIDWVIVDWVIVGGESGRNARKMEESWVMDIKNQCESANVPFFFKQWGGKNKKRNGRKLNGKIYDQMPAVIRKTEPMLF